jgi:hypothetical protein
MLRRQLSHDPTFGVYEDSAEGSFKIERLNFKYKNKNGFVDGIKYKTTEGLKELLTKSKPDKNVVPVQDKQHNELIIVSQVRSKPTNAFSLRGLFSDKLEVPWVSV